MNFFIKEQMVNNNLQFVKDFVEGVGKGS